MGARLGALTLKEDHRLRASSDVSADVTMKTNTFWIVMLRSSVEIHLKMEELYFSETSGNFYRTACCYNPEAVMINIQGLLGITR
jgi:hypothetical protein